MRRQKFLQQSGGFVFFLEKLKEQVKTNILNVLLTQQGERVNQPDFGAGLKNVLFENDIDTRFGEITFPAGGLCQEGF